MTESLDSRRLALVQSAQQQWIAALTDLGGRNTLLYYKDRRAGTLDLAQADPDAMDRFTGTGSIRLTRLFKDVDLRADAIRRMQAIHRKASATPSMPCWPARAWSFTGRLAPVRARPSPTDPRPGRVSLRPGLGPSTGHGDRRRRRPGPARTQAAARPGSLSVARRREGDLGGTAHHIGVVITQAVILAWNKARNLAQQAP
jgi:hypothetical protein